MKCNVTRADKKTNDQLQRKGKNPLTKTYTLNIEPMKRVLKTEGDIEKNGLKKALHICRGHFKNYMEGKGLFGKHHGLYWVDMHVKGSKENGEVIKDYCVKL